ncbi:hypothetical protein [Streptomyces liliifuscus]|uniref:Uncharacterized protein n=1 Tax=Streptomyces liliifuscus TaxID=2797636 RepID=A0A7T7L1Z6_9ACTN|nr:hypothetical protein [Streptomyces liliifuscus]QQM44972.1 hypothetical protein JEQ17_39945 [Streptomyces liliifuscus]
MTREERLAYIRRMVDGWPPLAPEQHAQLALLLTPEPSSLTEPAAVRPQQAAAKAA